MCQYVECLLLLLHMPHRPGRPRGVDRTTPHHTIKMLHFVLFHNVACCTNSLVSCIHVDTAKPHNITCVFVATCVILRSLECTRWRCGDYQTTTPGTVYGELRQNRCSTHGFEGCEIIALGRWKTVGNELKRRGASKFSEHESGHILGMNMGPIVNTSNSKDDSRRLRRLSHAVSDTQTVRRLMFSSFTISIEVQSFRSPNWRLSLSFHDYMGPLNCVWCWPSSTNSYVLNTQSNLIVAHVFFLCVCSYL